MVLCVGSSFDDVKDLAPIGAGIIAIITLLLGYREYREQGKQKKAEYFFELRKRFKENSVFIKVRNYLAGLGNIQEPTVQEMMDYIGFFEELQIMINSGLLKKETAYYMFGSYAIKCVDDREIVKCTNYHISDYLLKVFGVFYDSAIEWVGRRDINPMQIII